VRRRGVTLLESLFCTLFVGCVILAVVGLFAGSARALAHCANRARAGALAEEALEKVRATGFAQLSPGSQPIPAVVLEGISYAGTREILNDPTTPSQMLKRVRVTLRWSDRNRPQELVRESWLSALKS